MQYTSDHGQPALKMFKKNGKIGAFPPSYDRFRGKRAEMHQNRSIAVHFIIVQTGWQCSDLYCTSVNCDKKMNGNAPISGAFQPFSLRFYHNWVGMLRFLMDLGRFERQCSDFQAHFQAILGLLGVLNGWNQPSQLGGHAPFSAYRILRRLFDTFIDSNDVKSRAYSI